MQTCKKNYVLYDFVGAAYENDTPTKFILQSLVSPFRLVALLVTAGVDRFKFIFLTPCGL